MTPSAPQLINCEQDFLVEGGNSPEPPCMCRVTTLGSPSGRLVWRSGDAVLLYGDYGVTQLMFPYEKMDRTHSRKAVKCHVDWIDTWNSTSFSANIACNFLDFLKGTILLKVLLLALNKLIHSIDTGFHLLVGELYVCFLIH